MDELRCKSTLTNEFINLMSLYSYKKLISVPTRVINNSSTIIDNIYSNFPDIYNNGNSGVLGCVRTTDHMPIFSIRNVCKEIIKGEAFKLKRNFGNQNVSKFRKMLKNQNWNNVFSEECVQTAFSEFMKIVTSSFNECCPLEKVKIIYKNRQDWVTKELKADMKKREEMFKLSKKDPTEHNIQAHKKFRNMVLSRQRQAERKHFKELYDQSLNEQNYKKAWDITRFLIDGKSNFSKNKVTEYLVNNKKMTDPVAIANSFNDYFINVGKSLANTIVSQIDPLSYIDKSKNCITDISVTVNEVKAIVSQLNNSAAGPDDLPASIMKQVSNEYCIPLTHLINLSVLQGDFPSEMKLAKVLPIYKADNHQLIQNYRPISVLNFFSKVYERVIYNNLLDFIMENNILYDKQFGFRKGHSTSHAIITLVNKVSKSLDEGKIVGGVYLDIRKAFDSISHQILLDKLHKIGIRGNIHCLLKSYLMSRSQYVICNGAKSEVKFVETGVPQGSILGPLLFILFMNDFSRSSTLLFSILFADDTSVFLEGTEYSKLIKTLNNELENVTKWLNANRLTVNMKKTHYMIFHRAKFKTTGQDVVMQNSALTCVKTTKFLGVIIDHKFKWNDHITYVKRKISKSIGILYKIRRFLDMNTLIQMYHSFVFPYLIYCVEIWGNASAIHLDPLKKIQKKSIRAITFSEFSAPSEPLFQRSNILNFDKLVFQRICLMMFKHHIGVVPKPISDLFQTNDNFHSYSTRNSQALRTPIGKSEAIYQTFTYIGSLAWNYISSKIPTDVSYICFKNYAKLHIQANSLPQIRLNV